MKETILIILYKQLYERHSINKVNFTKGVSNRKYYLKLDLFQNTVWMTSFTVHCARTFYFTGESVCFHFVDFLFE